MALLPDQKFSTFADGGDLVDGDIVVGLRGGINTRFDFVISPTIDSVTGTLNQVLVNGTVGIPQTGDVVLTLPQSIATTNSPTFAGLTLTSPLTVANGGTGIQTATAFALLAGGTTATGAFQSLTVGTLGQLLQSNGPGVLPSWTAAAFPVGPGTLNHMLRSDGTNWVETTSTVLTSGDAMSGLTSLTAGNLNLAANSLISTDTNGSVSIIPNGTGSTLIGSTTSTGSSGLGAYLQVARGGGQGIISAQTYVNTTGAANLVMVKSRSTTINSFVTVQNGDGIGSINFFADDGTSLVSAGAISSFVTGAVSTGIVPTNLLFRTMNTSGVLTTGLTISNAQIITLANALPVGSGGLGITTTPSNGQIPIGNGTTYTAATITAGAGISVTNASGSITVAATGGGLIVATISGTTQSAAVNTKYFALNSGQTTLTLPSTYAVGDIVALIGATANTGGWIVATAAGDTIRVNNATTSAGGTVTSAAVAGQTIYLECDVANTSWVMSHTVSTTLTTS